MPSFFLPGITVWWRHRTVSPHCSVPATSYRGPPPLTVRSEESRVRSFKGGHKICHALVSEHAMWCSCCQSLPSGCKGMRRTWQSSTPSFCGPGQWKRRVVMSSLAKNERPERTSDVFAWQCPQHPQIAIASRLEAIASRLEAIARSLEAIASRLEAIARRFESIASRLEAIARRLDSIASRLEAIARRLESIASRLEAIASRLLCLQLCCVSSSLSPPAVSAFEGRSNIGRRGPPGWNLQVSASHFGILFPDGVGLGPPNTGLSRSKALVGRLGVSSCPETRTKR